MLHFGFSLLKELGFYHFHGSCCLSDDLSHAECCLHARDPSLQKTQTVLPSLKEWFSRGHLGSKPEENICLTQNSMKVRGVYTVEEE